VSASPRLYYDNPLWPDLLTAVNGNAITYDQSGNPTRWHDGTEFTWANGRQLVRAQNTRTGLDVSFTYDENGIRTGKLLNRNGVITDHTFYTQNGWIVGEVRRNANGVVTDRLEFIYDEAGRPVQMIHNGNTFNYVLNLQGDVQQIRCAWTGEVVATYMYNAFGEIWGAEGRMARINPLLYRGYFLCSSLGMYYLQSRYYDPWIGRFINADAFVSTGQGFLGMNMFAYCLNNPVMLIDPTGYVGFSTSGVQCWDALNWMAVQTGGSGNTTGWRGSSAQYNAIQNLIARPPRNTSFEFGGHRVDSPTVDRMFSEALWFRGYGFRLPSISDLISGNFNLFSFDTGLLEIGGNHGLGRLFTANGTVGVSGGRPDVNVGVRIVRAEFEHRWPTPWGDIVTGLNGELIGVGARFQFEDGVFRGGVSVGPGGGGFVIGFQRRE